MTPVRGPSTPARSAGKAASPMTLSGRASRAQLTFTLALIAMVSACVTTGTYDKKVAALDKVRADHDRAAASAKVT